MSVASQNLRVMRRAAGFRSARSAATALGVAFSTYGQHENGRRAFSILQGEHYAAFFMGAAIIDHFHRSQLAVPDSEVVAALIYDRVKEAPATRPSWADLAAADPHTANRYRKAAERVSRARGVGTPPRPSKAARTP